MKAARDQRLAALQATGLLDSEPEPAFDQLTSLVSRVLGAPVALVSLVDRDRQFFKSQVGLPEPWATRRQTPLSHSFCQHVADSGEPLIISDARTHELVRDNPAVAKIGVIAYAGMPVRDGDGHVLGALCAIDGRPRIWSPDELEILRALAAQANAEIELRTRKREQEAELDTLRAASIRQFRCLQAPLDAMILSVRALAYMGDWNEAQRECAALCLRDGDILRGLIDNLVDTARVNHEGRNALQLSRCAPHYLVASAVEQSAPAARRKSITVEAQMAPDLPELPADSDKLVRGLSCLIELAIDRTPADGRVQIAANVEAGTLRIAVADVGSSDRTTIPDSFQLGLAFCEQVSAAHGGTLEFRSRPEGGTEACLSLPLTSPRPEP